MHVGRQVLRGVHLDYPVDCGEIEAPGCDVCGQHRGESFLFEGEEKGHSFVLLLTAL